MRGHRLVCHWGYAGSSDCYTAGRKITPKGIMVHSTATPGVMAGAWFSRWNKSYKAGKINRQVCVHAFLDDKEIWQYLPWNHRGWHGGGAANNTYIGFEICEPSGFSYSGGSTMVGYDVKKNEVYFRAAWKNAVNLCVHLCKEYSLTEKDIISHAEGNKKGIASNHADVGHWFPKHGENMDSFRAAVKSALAKSDEKAQSFHVGDIVAIKPTASKYYPGGPTIPGWVKELHHKVTQTDFNGKPVLHAGRMCVLLGKRVDKKTKQESAGIMTWVNEEELILVDPVEDKADENVQSKKYYKVQVGAFSNRENAERLMKELTKAGFKGYVKYE